MARYQSGGPDAWPRQGERGSGADESGTHRIEADVASQFKNEGVVLDADGPEVIPEEVIVASRATVALADGARPRPVSSVLSTNLPWRLAQ